MGGTCPQTHIHHSDFISCAPLGCMQLKRKLHSNPPVLIRMSGIIRKCTGCEEYFAEKYRKPPHDVIFKFMMYRK